MLVLRVHHSALDNMNVAQMYCSPCRGNIAFFVVFRNRSDKLQTFTVWKLCETQSNYHLRWNEVRWNELWAQRTPTAPSRKL
jgi:hypothetical protein